MAQQGPTVRERVLFVLAVVLIALWAGAVTAAIRPAPLKLCRVSYLLPTRSGWYYAELRPADKRMEPCLFTFAGATEP